MKFFFQTFFTVICLVQLSLPASSQVNFKTIVPSRSISPGESFQVQYILENAENIANFSAPAFAGFRVVTGPHTYAGKKLSADNQTIHYNNLVFTLAAVSEGEFTIDGASCTVNGKLLKSNPVTIKVISQKDADESSYFLKPGEDPIKKIHDNLFLKLSVDRRNCYVGEPLVATFKLYSRLQSKSNVVKNPGFYGFSVYDMIGVSDNIQSEEKINGHWFDVHTIRKLQLYPLEPGRFTIDPMELTNQVEFSRSQVSKRSEQEVTENMYGKKDSKAGENTESYDISIKSEPAIVDVKPLPHKNVADSFAGAVGQFTISAFVRKDTILKNEEDSLIIDIAGAGNFQRVNPPVINWPRGIEVFQPVVSDTFDKQHIPLAGQRTFKFIFVSDKPGFYTIPSSSFTFFNSTLKSYQTISTKSITFFISAKTKKDLASNSARIVTSPVFKQSFPKWIIAVGIGLMAALLLIIRRARLRSGRPAQVEPATQVSIVSPEGYLIPAKSAIDNGQFFYQALTRSIWDYFNDRLKPFDALELKHSLSKILLTKGVAENTVREMIEVFARCETGTYAAVDLDVDKSALLAHTSALLNKIDKYI